MEKILIIDVDYPIDPEIYTRIKKYKKYDLYVSFISILFLL